MAKMLKECLFLRVMSKGVLAQNVSWCKLDMHDVGKRAGVQSEQAQAYLVAPRLLICVHC